MRPEPVNVRWDDNRLVLSGEIDLDNAGSLRDAVDEAIADRPTELVIVAAALEFCDSTCLACILRVLQAGLPVRIERPSAVLIRALGLSGIDQHPLLVIE